MVEKVKTVICTALMAVWLRMKMDEDKAEVKDRMSEEDKVHLEVVVQAESVSMKGQQSAKK